jgi:hypothetical protein
MVAWKALLLAAFQHIEDQVSRGASACRQSGSPSAKRAMLVEELFTEEPTSPR